MYIERLFAPVSGMDRRSFFMPKFMGKSERLEVWFLSKIVYSPDKPNDCRYCHFWKNNKTGCCLGEEKCYYLRSDLLPDKDRRRIECSSLQTMWTRNQQLVCGSATSGKTGISVWCRRSGKDAEIVLWKVTVRWLFLLERMWCEWRQQDWLRSM